MENTLKSTLEQFRYYTKQGSRIPELSKLCALLQTDTYFLIKKKKEKTGTYSPSLL